MAADPRTPALRRAIALGFIVAAGLAAIVGSGGGSSGGECGFFSNLCNPVVDIPAFPLAAVAPARQTVQAGANVTFTSQVSGVAQPAYQWRRSSDGGASYVDIAGATGASYTLANATVADDGAVFSVQVSAGGAVVATGGQSRLLVSSLPGVVFGDGEFTDTDWLASAVATPAVNGPLHSEARVTSGGIPDAFRRMAHTMSAGPSSLRVFNLRQSTVYDPAALGAIHAIDYTEDCKVLSTAAAGQDLVSTLLVEQAGRRYVSTFANGCQGVWLRFAGAAQTATNFTFVDGPPCGAGETCPDFSAAGQPLRFGFERRATRGAGAAAAVTDHGIDNWQVTVWRR